MGTINLSEMVTVMLLLLSFVAPAVTFAPEAGAIVLRTHASAVQMQAERSASIPFLKRPPALDGSMVGDVGFDPLGFTTTITELGGDLNYVREAELMHGRQAMLACVGFVFPVAVGKLPVAWTADVSTNPLVAQYQLPDFVLAQLVLSIAIAEGLRAQIIYKADSVPGERGFDPLGFIPKFCDTPEKMAEMKLKELKHCRIAMIAVTGAFFQIAYTGTLYPFF